MARFWGTTRADAEVVGRSSAVYNMGMLYLHNDIFITSAKEVVFSSLFVCLLATLHKNFQTDLREIFTEGWHWASEQMVKF